MDSTDFVGVVPDLDVSGGGVTGWAVLSGGCPGSDVNHQWPHERHCLYGDGAGVERCRLGAVFDRICCFYPAAVRVTVDHDHRHES